MSKDIEVKTIKSAVSCTKITPPLKSPIGRVGGKSKLSKDIISLFPKHKHYVEVFGGGLSVLFAKQRSKLESVNDINSELINLFKIIRDKPESLSYVLEQMLISREVFEDIKTKKDAPSNDIKRAAYFYYLISQSFWSKGTHFAMNAKSGRKPKNLWRNFMTWSKRLHFVTIENLSFEELIKRYDKEDTFFYLDPPYYNYEKVYTSWFSKEQHLFLRDTLKNIKWKFLLSYNDCPEIRELYKFFTIKSSKEIEYTLGKNKDGKHKSVKELYITNY